MELRDQGPKALRPVAAGVARVALLAGPTALAFFDGGYFEGPRLTAAIVAWVLVAVLALAVDGGVPTVPAADLQGSAAGPGHRRWVPRPSPLLPRSTALRLALGGLAGLTLWAWLSRSWAPLAGPAGDDLQRDVLYLGALVAAALAFRSRGWASSVEAVLAAGIVVVVGYGLAGRLLPGVVEVGRSVSAGGRLEEPLTYWNAMGALAAVGVVLCARLAADALRADALRCLAAASGVALGLGLYLTYSRGALAAVGCGLLVLTLLVPTWEQLRSTATIALGAAVVSLVASQFDGVASLAGDAAHQEAQGVLMLSILVAVAIVVAAVQALGTKVERERRIRLGRLPISRGVRLAGWAVAIALALFPYAAAVVSERGEENPAFGANAERLGSIGSNRYAYWRVAARTLADHPLQGAGAGSFRVEWLRERPFRESVRDAHSLYFETAAELGLVGLLLLAALLAGALLAVRRALESDAAMAAGPAAALAVWVVHAGVDWDWEMPALTLVAVLLAGTLLGRVEAEAQARRAAAPTAPSA
ncbi:MAG TPA: O-antigen ligase family protein [Capillimicrobium sp.]